MDNVCRTRWLAVAIGYFVIIFLEKKLEREGERERERMCQVADVEMQQQERERGRLIRPTRNSLNELG